MAPRRVLLLSLTGLFLALIASRPVHGLDWTVDITADENDGVCAPGDCSLREAIAAAGDGDSVLFALPGGSPWTITLTGALGQLSLTQDITLTGPGATQLAISGGNLVRVMTVQAGATVTISGLTLRNGEAKSSGDKHGGCLKVLGTATVSASRFESCQAWNGGVSSNTPGGDGGGVYVAVGGVFTGSLLVFSGDVAGVGGGALAPPTVFAGGFGGGLANAGSATLTQTTVSGCTAGAGGGPYGPGGGGGGIANLTGGVLRIDASTLTGNRTGDGATFMVPGSDGRGGGLLCQADCTLNNVTLSGNAIGTSAAGAAAQGGGLFVSGGTTRLRNVTVAGNTANSTGGGMARFAGTVRMRNSLFAGNTGASSNHDCTTNSAANIVSEGHNLIRVNDGCAASFTGTDQEGTNAVPLEPLLAALAANGGPTDTRALGAGSPAIDHGDSLGCASWNPVLAMDEPLVVDQRGEPRPIDGDGDATATCDVGAFEAAAAPPIQHLLTVTVAGAGSGDVTSVPAGIACPGDCTESWVLTQNVQLSATPAPGSYFSGWSGACSGSGACNFTMATDRTVTATFGLLRALDVAVAGPGGGSVASTPGGIACPGDCTEEYANSTPVALAATPGPGSYFVGWSGDCAGSAGCNLSLTANRAVTATFGLLRTLTVTVASVEGGAGSVASVPSGISCPGDCSQAFADGTSVTLTATPSPGSIFVGWSGDCTGSGTCQPALDADRAVIASFLSLTVFIDGFGAGDPCTWSIVVGGVTCPP